MILLAMPGTPLSAQTTFVLPDTVPLSSVERVLLHFEQARSAAIARHDTAMLRLMYPTTTFLMDELAVRRLDPGGQFAFLTGRLTTRRNTGERVAASRFFHLYVWRDGRWQILAAQGTALPPPSARFS